MNIKTNSRSGFTIVELLIVIVVIAILAAITIVSYNGITARANSSSAQSTASTFAKKAEAYNAEVGRYPITREELTNATSDKSYQLPSTAFTSLSADPTATSANNSLFIQRCGATAVTATNVTGVKISYYKYDGSDKGVKTMSAGVTTTCETAAMPAS